MGENSRGWRMIADTCKAAIADCPKWTSLSDEERLEIAHFARQALLHQVNASEAMDAGDAAGVMAHMTECAVAYGAMFCASGRVAGMGERKIKGARLAGKRRKLTADQKSEQRYAVLREGLDGGLKIDAAVARVCRKFHCSRATVFSDKQRHEVSPKKS